MTEPRQPVLIYLNAEERAALEKRATQEDRSVSAMGRQLLIPHLMTPPGAADPRKLPPGR